MLLRILPLDGDSIRQQSARGEPLPVISKLDLGVKYSIYKKVQLNAPNIVS
jgi:hypothetical protein